MNLSCLPVSYFKKIISGHMSIKQWACEASKLGFDAIDLSVILLENRNAYYLQSVRSDIETAEMTLAVMNTYPDFTHPDAEVRRQQKSKIHEDIVASSLLGAEMIRVTAGQAHPQTSRKDGIRWAVEGLLSTVDIATECGVKVLYENHSKPGVWQYPDFSLATDIFLEIAEVIKETPIQILFDTANPLVYGDNPLVLLEKIIDRVGCVHAADTKTKGTLNPAVIGTGVVPFDEIFSCLVAYGYDGWISLEEASNTGVDGIIHASKFVRNMWENKVTSCK